MAKKDVRGFYEEFVIQKKACGQMLVDAFENKTCHRVRRHHFVERGLYLDSLIPRKRGISITVFHHPLTKKGPEASLVSAYVSGGVVVIGSWLNGRLGWMLPVRVLKATDKLVIGGLWKTTFYCVRARR